MASKVDVEGEMIDSVMAASTITCKISTAELTSDILYVKSASLGANDQSDVYTLDVVNLNMISGVRLNTDPQVAALICRGGIPCVQRIRKAVSQVPSISKEYLSVMAFCKFADRTTAKSVSAKINSVLTFFNSNISGSKRFYGALAVSMSSNAWGISTGGESLRGVAREALAKCANSRKDCRLVTLVWNTCLALYTGNNGVWSWGNDSTKEEAEQRARASCTSSGCSVAYSECFSSK